LTLFAEDIAMWTLLKTACVAAAVLSLVFVLWACMKVAGSEGESGPKISSGDPDVTIAKKEPASAKEARETAWTVMSVAGVTFVASLCGFGFAAWRQRSRPRL
jgi:hypothetical protein